MLKQKLDRKQLEAAVLPKCLRCEKAINPRPKWQAQGWLHKNCEQASDSIEIRRAVKGVA